MRLVYQISSGQGPAECELGVAKLLRYLSCCYDITVLETSIGFYEDTYRSVRFSTDEDLSEYLGSVQWVCRSPYRPEHKRKNWFLDFSACETAVLETFDESKIVFETFRSGGKGGQNVNKVETGVRAIYTPTGFAVECTEERSQYANKQKAVARMKTVFQAEAKRRLAAEKNGSWQCHARIERGNAGIVFRGMDFARA